MFNIPFGFLVRVITGLGFYPISQILDFLGQVSRFHCQISRRVYQGSHHLVSELVPKSGFIYLYLLKFLFLFILLLFYKKRWQHKKKKKQKQKRKKRQYKKKKIQYSVATLSHNVVVSQSWLYNIVALWSQLYSTAVPTCQFHSTQSQRNFLVFNSKLTFNFKIHFLLS